MQNTDGKQLSSKWQWVQVVVYIFDTWGAALQNNIDLELNIDLNCPAKNTISIVAQYFLYIYDIQYN